MEWNYRDDLPIYSQLVEQLKRAIVSGAMELGARLMSVRDLAVEAGVNPNTMQRALSELESEGLVYSQRTAGRFITDNKGVIEKVREEMAKSLANEYKRQMSELGFDVAGMRDMIKEEK